MNAKRRGWKRSCDKNTTVTNEFWSAALGLGFVLGLRHALDPDHIAAVSTIVSEHKTMAKSALVGAFWGIGHTASLLGVGLIVIALRLEISGTAANWMEFAVSIMLVALGARAIKRSLAGMTMHVHTHTHDGSEHVHIHFHYPGEQHSHSHEHVHFLGVGAPPFLIGMVHGLAGSAGLMILVLSTIHSTAAALAYIAVFGLGSVGGMILMSSVISAPFVLTPRRFTLLIKGLQFSVGLGSLVFGLSLAWEYLKPGSSLVSRF